MPQKTFVFIHDIPERWKAKEICSELISVCVKQKLIAKGQTVFLNVSGVSNKKMTALNSEFRGKKKTTDVLSFEQKSKKKSKVLFLGDLVLCLPVVKKQAREHGHSIDQELCVLLSHGLLHLLGYDHEKSAKKAEEMKQLEIKLLQCLKKNLKLPLKFRQILISGLIERSQDM